MSDSGLFKQRATPFTKESRYSVKNMNKILKPSSPEPMGQYQQNFAQRSTFWYNHSSARMSLLIGTVSQVSDVTHGPFSNE